MTYLESNATALEEVLLYHVLPEKLLTKDIQNGAHAVTLQGESVTFQTAWHWSWYHFHYLYYIWIDGKAFVSQPNIPATNGVIHVIEQVLLPDSIPDDLLYTAASSGILNTLVQAVHLANLTDILLEPGTSFTLLAPSDEAFQAIEPAILNYLFHNTTALKQVLLYHVIAGTSIFAADVAASNSSVSVASALGPELTLTFDDFSVFINANESIVEQADIIALNGVAHVIDTVLIPPDLKIPPTLVDLLTDKAELSSLKEALVEYELDDLFIDTKGWFTIFAPSNDALADVDFDGLTKDQVKETLLYHIVPGYYSTHVLQTYGAHFGLLTKSGDYVAVQIDKKKSQITIDTIATVVESDVGALNGVVHVIDTVLTPPIKCPYTNHLRCWWEGY